MVALGNSGTDGLGNRLAFGYTRPMAEADLRHRDRRGEWLPDPLPAPSALFSWPLRLWPALKSLVAFYWPYNLFYTVLAVVCWLWFPPDMGPYPPPPGRGIRSASILLECFLFPDAIAMFS